MPDGEFDDNSWVSMSRFLWPPVEQAAMPVAGLPGPAGG
jgi:hypothetical protein